jgi:hypothetical protein
MKVNILVFFFLFVIISDFDFSYLHVCCVVSCIGCHVFLLLDSGCSSSVVLFVLTTA